MDEYKIDIPDRFYSDAEGKPFEYCQMCDKFLLIDGTTYVVEKAVKNYEGYDFGSTIFEFAVCIECHTKVQQNMSEESLANLHAYYKKIMQEKGNTPIVIDVRDFDLDEWLSKCFFKGDEINKMNEYQLNT